MIPNFRTYLNESVWGDLRKKSLGQEERMEDDVNSLGCADFCEYLKTKYEGYCDTDHIGRTDNYIKFHLAVGANLHIRYNDDGKTIKEIAVEPFGKNFFSGFEAELKSKNVKHNLSADFDGLDTFEIKGKNGNTSNRTVIEFIDNYFNYVIDEEGEKILMKLCDKLRPDYEKGEEITLDKILDLAKYELVVSRYSKKARFFNFIEKNYDDIMDIIKNGTGVYESVWGDLRKKSLGQEERIEDNLNNLNVEGLYNYIKNRYEVLDKWTKFNYFVRTYQTDISVPIYMDKSTLHLDGPVRNSFTFHLNFEMSDNGKREITMFPTMESIKYSVDFTKSILYNKLCDEFYMYKKHHMGLQMLHIEPKDGGKVDSNFYIKVLDFITDNYDESEHKIIGKA